MNKIVSLIDKFDFSFVTKCNISDIVFDSSLRKMCEMNTCRMFGDNYMCPPHVGQIDDCISKVKGYENVIVVQTICQLEDSFDFDGMMLGQTRHNTMVKELFDQIASTLPHYLSQVLFLSAGPCTNCPTCSLLIGQPCVAPHLAMSSVEAHGIDVNRSLVNVGLKYNNGENTVSYVAMIFAKGDLDE